MPEAGVTGITRILQLVGNSISISNGCHNSKAVAVSSLPSRHESPIEVSTVSEVLPILVERGFAARCRNPRDGADHLGCLEDHNFEVPRDLNYHVFDAFLKRIDETLWLAGSSTKVPGVGRGRGSSFSLTVSLYPATSHAKLDLSLEEIWLDGDLYSGRGIQAEGPNPEAAIEFCILRLMQETHRAAMADKLAGLMRQKLGLTENCNLWVRRRPNETKAVTWCADGAWFCAVGDDEASALIKAIEGQLTCAHDEGRGCILVTGHDGEHQPPVNPVYGRRGR